jgi:sulfur carrier protein
MSPPEPKAAEPGALIRLNGALRRTPPGMTVAGLVREIAGGGEGIAVAVNREVVRRGRWAATELRDGDAVEVLAAVQGG